MYNFSIIIVSWNTYDLINQCLLSIYNNLNISYFEVIVVDNNSSDGSRKLLLSFENKYNNFTLISNNENLGFAFANNQAFAISQFETIVLLNPDIKLINDKLLDLIKLVNTNHNIGLLSCNLFNNTVEKQSIHRKLPTIRSVFFRYSYIGRFLDKYVFNNKFNYSYKYIHCSRNKIENIEQPAAAVLVFRKRILNNSSFIFNVKFPIYGNDVDLSKRVLDLGYMNFVDYSISIWHKESSSLSLLNKSKHNHLRKEWLPRYFLLHYGKLSMFIVKLILKV